LKKKTYVFDRDTLNILESLKRELGKKEVQILREALSSYMEKVKNIKQSAESLSGISSKMDMVLVHLFELTNKFEDLNVKLHRIEGLLSKGHIKHQGS
jgi:CMP-N-acetylneuraminic acid synthetase